MPCRCGTQPDLCHPDWAGYPARGSAFPTEEFGYNADVLIWR